MWSSHRYIARTSLSCNDASQTGLCTSLDHHWILYRLSIPSQWIQWISAGSCALCQQWFQLSSDSWSGAWADGRSHFSCAALGFQWVLRWSSAFGVVFSVDLWMLRYPNAKRPQSAVNWCWCPESRVQRYAQKVTILTAKKMQGIWGQNSAVFVEGGLQPRTGLSQGRCLLRWKVCLPSQAPALVMRNCRDTGAMPNESSWYLTHRWVFPKIDDPTESIKVHIMIWWRKKQCTWSLRDFWTHPDSARCLPRCYLGNFAESKTLDYTFPMPRVLWNKKLWLVLQEETDTGTVGRVEFRLWKEWRHDLWSQWLA
jgi:hypothetical protein